ncbi:YybH family protein [Actinomycetospora sp. CA-053990]|uniref:YybH family protein n=1 Tax=Actinomycetospora sp. CA-053990 TaxID=3239891 RepID=UPI003D94AA67
MTIMSPAQGDEAWRERFNAGDVEGLLALYEEDAIFVPEPGGKPLVGREAIRDFVVNFPIEDATVEFRPKALLERDTDALSYSDWTIRGTGPEGPTEMEGQATVLMRRQDDGTWLIAMDDPFTHR